MTDRYIYKAKRLEDNEWIEGSLTTYDDAIAVVKAGDKE